jgi:hypothetical protein
MKLFVNLTIAVLCVAALPDLTRADAEAKVGVDIRDRAQIRKHLAKELKELPELADEELFRLPNHATFSMRDWTLHLNDQLWKDDDSIKATHTMLRLLSGQLQRVVSTVPVDAVAKLRKVPIWINPEYENERPRCEYHPGAGWLSDNGRDPVMEKAVEISNVAIFEFENRRMPYLMLHELSHAYHDQVLGFDEPRIIAAFELARDSGSYDSVKRFTGKKTVTDKAYALSNHKEYFSESTEAYFGKNDFYPFDRVELRKHDRQIHDLLEKLWGVSH